MRTGPLVNLGLSFGQEGRRVTATIDSGAGRSAFPIWVAEELGIKKLLSKDPRKSEGVGSKIRTWSADNLLIDACVLDPTDDDRPWGDRFKLRPSFWKHDVALLGREDFFAAFNVTFMGGSYRWYELVPSAEVA